MHITDMVTQNITEDLEIPVIIAVAVTLTLIPSIIEEECRNRFFFSGTLLLFQHPMGIGNLVSGSSAFPKSNLNIWKFTACVLLKPGLENFESIALLACAMTAIVR